MVTGVQSSRGRGVSCDDCLGEEGSCTAVEQEEEALETIFCSRATWF